MEVAVQELQMIIKWAKQLSTFNDLDVDDQINLLSEGRPKHPYSYRCILQRQLFRRGYFFCCDFFTRVTWSLFPMLPIMDTKGVHPWHKCLYITTPVDRGDNYIFISLALPTRPGASSKYHSGLLAWMHIISFLKPWINICWNKLSPLLSISDPVLFSGCEHCLWSAFLISLKVAQTEKVYVDAVE